MDHDNIINMPTTIGLGVMVPCHKCGVYCQKNTTGSTNYKAFCLSPYILENITLLLMFSLKFRRLFCVDVFQSDCGLHLREKKFVRHQTHYSAKLEAKRKSKKLLLYLPFEEADSFCISSHFATKQVHCTHTQ